MPVLKKPPGSVAQNSLSALAHQLQTSNANIYLVLAILAVLAVARLIKLRLHPAHSTALPHLPASDNIKEAKENWHGHTFPVASPPSSDHSSLSHPLSSPSWPWLRDKLGGIGLQSGLVHQLQQAVWAAKPLPFSPRTGLLRPFGRFGQQSAMGGTDGDQLKDHSESASRGVSTNSACSSDLGHQHDSEGNISKSPRGKFKGPMVDPTSHADGIWSATYDGEPNTASPQQLSDEGLAQIGFSLNTVDSTGPRHSARAPTPPPPWRSPTMSNVVHPFQDRRPSYAVSIPPELDTSFTSSSNLEYDDASSTSAHVQSASPQSSSAIPRRRSYTRSIPIPITSSSSSTASMTSGTTFSPSSYPPSSPLLPPPPPVNDAPSEYVFVGGPGGPGVFLEEREIDIHDEIISVMDEEGHGWKRHTRVYGGNGACLACLSSEDQGGFYGDKVPLADRR
ncbi:hypothetical protein QBC42DRAFT_349821 [Cladorrhinum samala]|uniref:Uncharacterized protein n=1 Tax=Cladorrhinum samala TaxID=585594 RepID=A0AAV9HGJ9_9PEZI|nr:hypothetical protein QBC42DRAFT_349821 [Cladorrhinum samala]